jgi:hypothetical protein
MKGDREMFPCATLGTNGSKEVTRKVRDNVDSQGH